MKTQTQIQLDSFQRAYVECALWSSLDDDCKPLDDGRSADDIADECLAQMQADCNDFRAAHANALDASGLSIEQQGHDFWLTRNGHGAGFWDRGIGEIGRQLSDASKIHGSFDLYIGDDGLIYGQ